jgi:hypothetical protein
MGSQKEEWVSLREFARLCGRSHRAAQKAIEDRRIPASAIRHDAQGHIVAVEYHQASACWRANSDPRRSLKDFPPRSPRLPVQTSGRDPVLDEHVPQLLGVAFANALIPACAMSVWRHGLSPGQALDAHEDQLLAVMYAIADALQLSPDDDRPRVLFAMTSSSRSTLSAAGRCSSASSSSPTSSAETRRRQKPPASWGRRP